MFILPARLLAYTGLRHARDQLADDAEPTLVVVLVDDLQSGFAFKPAGQGVPWDPSLPVERLFDWLFRSKVEKSKVKGRSWTFQLFDSSTSSHVLDDLLAGLRPLHLGGAFHQAMEIVGDGHGHEVQANDTSQAG